MTSEEQRIKPIHHQEKQGRKKTLPDIVRRDQEIVLRVSYGPCCFASR